MPPPETLEGLRELRLAVATPRVPPKMKRGVLAAVRHAPETLAEAHVVATGVWPLVAPLDELWEILKPSETMKRVALLDGE